MGVKLMDLEGEDRLIAVARVSSASEDEELQAAPEAPDATPSGDDVGEAATAKTTAAATTRHRIPIH